MPNPQDRTIITPSATLQLSVPETSPYLLVLFPLEMHRRFALEKNRPVVLGRSQEADVLLADEMISRSHCQVVWDGRKIRVQDMSSTNGTYVDGTQITESELGPDNRLQVGKCVLKVEFKDSSEIERENALFEAATTDALTKVPNRRFFLERARAEWSAAKRTNRYIHAILLDVDFFKKVNDTYGHAAGDFVLKEIAALLDKMRRSEDPLARWGGEEFVFILPGIEPKQAEAFAERARKAVEALRIVWEDARIPVTISLGVASMLIKESDTLDTLIAQADARLYQAKRLGRNQVCAE